MHLPFYVTFLGIIHYNFVKWCAMFFLSVQYALLVLQFQAAPTHEWKSTCDVNLTWDGKGDSLQAVKPETTSIVGDHHNQANLGLIIRWSSNLGLVLTWFSSLTNCLCPVEHPQHPYQPPILTAPNKSTFQSGLLRNSQASGPYPLFLSILFVHASLVGHFKHIQQYLLLLSLEIEIVGPKQRKCRTKPLKP